MKPLKPITLTLAQFKQERIVLESFVHPGDEVIVARQADFGRDGYEQPLPPDGTRAWVVGHTTYFNFVGHNNGHLEPGVYRRHGHAVYQYFDAEGKQQFGHLNPHQLIFADPLIEKHQDRREGPIWDMYHDGTRVADLPETSVMVGDIVKVSGRVAASFRQWDGLARVDGVEYHWNSIMDQFDPNGTGLYRLTPIEGGFTTTANESEVALHERGNYYWNLHDKSKLKFADLKEKAGFYKSIGKSVELRNPASGNYAWGLDEALDYLSQGRGAGFVNPIALFGARPNGFVHLFDFPDLPALAKEIREETLRGFDRTVPTT